MTLGYWIISVRGGIVGVNKGDIRRKIGDVWSIPMGEE